jgi:hypothetical protein
LPDCEKALKTLNVWPWIGHMKKHDKRIVVRTAQKPIGDGRMVNLILSEDPRKLDAFTTQFGDPGRDLYLMHTRKGAFIAIDQSREHSLGFNCPECGQLVCRYAGEWQERVHCGCTMLFVPLDFDELARDMTLDAWAVTISSAREGLAGSVSSRRSKES